MKAPQAIFLVARREYLERVREKSFVIGLVVTMAIILAAVLLPPLIFGDDGPRSVALAGEGSQPYAEALGAVASELDLEVETEELASAEAATRAVEDGEVEAAVVDGSRLITTLGPGDELRVALQSVAQQLQVVERLGEAGVAPDDALALLDPAPLEVTDPDDAAEEEDASTGLSFLVSLVLYGQLLGMGYLVGSGIVEEKATRVVELLLATVRPGHLLAGKIIGIGLVGLTQLVVMAGIGLGAVLGTGLIDLPEGAYTAIGLGIAWFLLGYAFYACAYATLSSLVSRQEEVQNVTTTATLFIFGAFFLSFAAIDDPTGTIARVASYIPPFAPLVMPARGTSVEPVEVVASVGITLAAAALLVVVAGKVYAGAVLRTGSKVKLRQALRAGD